MSKISEAQRSKLEALDEHATAYAEFAEGFVDGHAAVEQTKRRPETSQELDRGRWVRNPSDGGLLWVAR